MLLLMSLCLTIPAMAAFTDTMDEASAMIRTEIDSMPTEVDEVRRRVLQLEIERQALKKETYESSKKY